MKYNCLQWEDVAEEEILPGYDYELSLLRLVAFVRATGLYDYVHFDEKYAQAAGARGAFMATPHVAGLFGRLLTDWAGPGADIRSLKFSMQKQNCAGDVLTVRGKVTRKYVSEDGEHLVDIGDMSVSNDKDGQSVAASATIALPSRLGPPMARHCRIKESVTKELPDDVPDFARSLIGKVIDGLPEPARALTEDEIHLWCEALEDWNPLYWDQDFAATARTRGIVAPPMGVFYGAGSATTLGVGYSKPGTVPPSPVREGLRGLELLQALRSVWQTSINPIILTEYPEVAVVVAHADYYNPLRPGDTARSTIRLLNCSAKKRTGLGEGHFVTVLHSLHNQRGELVRDFTLTLLLYRV